MTAATQKIEPMSNFDTDPIDNYSTKAALAGHVAWDVLTHSQGDGPDIARMTGPEGNRRPLPKGMDAEDMWTFVFDLVTSAGEIGYAVAQIETAGLERRWEDAAKLRTVDLARAVAGLLRIDLVEDDEAFDPGWLARVNAEYEARKAAAA